jgi:hypothetical protein
MGLIDNSFENKFKFFIISVIINTSVQFHAIELSVKL